MLCFAYRMMRIILLVYSGLHIRRFNVPTFCFVLFHIFFECAVITSVFELTKCTNHYPVIHHGQITPRCFRTDNYEQNWLQRCWCDTTLCTSIASHKFFCRSKLAFSTPKPPRQNVLICRFLKVRQCFTLIPPPRLFVSKCTGSSRGKRG